MTAADEAPTEAAGLFGPGSLGWRVDRELVVLAGGSCALLLQAAHPVVAAGVAEHSTYATDPFGRLMRTLSSSFDVAFGSRSTAEATIRRVNAIHARVRGDLADGTPYSAMDPEALLWVHATLVDTALRVYRGWVGPLTSAEEQRYHEEAAEIAVRLGVPAASVPATLVELRAWMDEMVATGTVHVTPAAREIAATVLYPLPWVPRLAWDAAHLISLSTLRPDIRRQYGLGWTDARERGARRLAAVSRRLLPLLPAALRHAPEARSAERRAASAGRVDAVGVTGGDHAEAAALEVAGGGAARIGD
jgi:uncharacterized protein (DUF2236 family)